jgi:hypothetical protein
VLASVVFLTPAGALLALAAVVPLAAVGVAARRERRARELLDLPAPPPVRRLPRLFAVAAVPLLLGLAAAQPAIRRAGAVRVRTDAQAFVVLDISRSMLAASAPGAQTRLARAKQEAIAVRDALPDVPTGVVTMTDRAVPQLFPTASTGVFAGTVEHAVSIEEPPPSSSDVRGTDLSALGALGTQNYFPPSVRKRLAIVFTDGESRPFDVQQVRRQLASGPGVELVLVHVWRPGETVYDGRQAEGGYHEDSSSGQVLQGLASAVGGKAVDAGSPAAVVAAARAALGRGPVAREGTSEQTATLAPYVALAALVPLLLLLGPRVAARRLRILQHRPAKSARPVPLHGER